MKNGAGKREVRIVYTEEIIPAAILFLPNRSQSFLSNTLILAVMNIIFAIALGKAEKFRISTGI